MPRSYKTPYWLERGFTECLCTRRGALFQLAERNLANTICRLCPKDSNMKALALHSFLVVRMVERDEWWHISML